MASGRITGGGEAGMFDLLLLVVAQLLLINTG